jgi:DNA-binding Xre family transcriptional regulator
MASKRRPVVHENIEDWKYYVNLAQVVSILMDEQEYSTRELSEVTGISYPAINFIITGKKMNITYSTIAKLCMAFGVTPAVFLMPENALKQMLKYSQYEFKRDTKKRRGAKSKDVKNVPRDEDVEAVSLKSLRNSLKG